MKRSKEEPEVLTKYQKWHQGRLAYYRKYYKLHRTKCNEYSKRWYRKFGKATYQQAARYFPNKLKTPYKPLEVDKPVD